MNTGTNAAWIAASANRLRTSVRDQEGDRERRHLRADPEVAGGEDLADQARDPRERGGDREEGGRAREAPERGPRWPRSSIGRGLGLGDIVELDRARAGLVLPAQREPAASTTAGLGCALTGSASRTAAIVLRRPMANIASQKKRNARTVREHEENRRMTSAVKTHFKRLEAAVAGGRRRRDRGRAPRALLAGRQGGRARARCIATTAHARRPARRAFAPAPRPRLNAPAARRTASVSATRSG